MDLPLRDLPANLYWGWNCFLGQSAVYEYESEPPLLSPWASETSSAWASEATSWNNGTFHDTGLPPDNCATAPFFVSSYLIFNILYNILIVVILKYGSANIMYLGSTALVPLTNATFALKWIPGHQPVHPTDVAGLLLIMAGICCYRFYDAAISAVDACCKRRRLYQMTPNTRNRTELTQEESRRQGEADRDEIRRRRNEVQKRAALYIGLNQAEMMQPIMDSRTRKATKSPLLRRKSNAEVRSRYMAKLSPHLSPKYSVVPQTFPPMSTEPV